MSERVVFRTVGKNIHLLVAHAVKNDDGEITEERSLVFEGGEYFPKRKPGAYRTQDPQEIKTLREHPFNTDNAGPNYFEEAESASAEDSASQDESAPDGDETGGGDVIVVEDVELVNEAIDYLVDNYDDLSTSKVRNKKDVLSYAEQKGVKFPNLSK